MIQLIEHKIKTPTHIHTHNTPHLLTEFYLVSATDIFVDLSCIWVLILCFLSSN